MTSTQTWDPARYRESGGFIAAYGEDVVALLDPQPGERILDIGCGDGRLTAVIAASGADVVGIDASAEQVAAARESGLDARRIDVLSLDAFCAYDAVFSNAALHWVPAPDEAARRIFDAITPGGRFVGELGGKGNVHLVSRAIFKTLENRGLDGTPAWPWFFPSEQAYAGILRNAGFEVIDLNLFERPTVLPGRFADWVETFARPFLELVEDDDCGAFLADVERIAAAVLLDDDGIWRADYVRLRFAARKPEAA